MRRFLVNESMLQAASTGMLFFLAISSRGNRGKTELASIHLRTLVFKARLW